VDVAGNVATVGVDSDLDIGDDVNVGTDDLTLARVGDRWPIAPKAYDSSRPYTGPPK